MAIVGIHSDFAVAVKPGPRPRREVSPPTLFQISCLTLEEAVFHGVFISLAKGAPDVSDLIAGIVQAALRP